ncbi:alpha/beta hydrolase [Fodinicola feengrottensis]|nr:alpha/beta fold hydrolase [Fodinicola feengrottensis]
MVTRRNIRFTVDGLSLAGTLHEPDTRDAGARPAVLVAGPSPQVKEQVPDTYAVRIAAAGFPALTIDFRGFGESEGQPRLREMPAGKLADLRAAVSFLAAQPDIDADRIAIVGICAGAGYALKAAAQDPRLAAFAGIAGFYPDLRTLRDAMGEDGYRAALRQAIEVLAEEDRTGEVGYLPHVGPIGAHALLQGGEVYEFYGSERAASANYRNEITADTMYTMLTLDTATAADLVGVPALIVHGEKDGACPPERAVAVHDRLAGPARLEWLPVDTHIGFYDDEASIGPAIAALTDFLDKSL